MTIGYGDRFNLPQWGDGATDGPTRVLFNAAFDEINDNAALDTQSVIVSRPIAGIRGRYHWATDESTFARDDGTQWVELPTYANAGTWTAQQRVTSDTAQQVLVDSATTGASSSMRVRRRTASDLSTYRYLDIETTANVSRLRPFNYNDSGIGSDISGMSGRWAINWNSDTAPSETLIIKAKGGAEIARFTEGGMLGIGVTSPGQALDVRAPSATIPVARFGGPSGSSQDYAMSMTPAGAGRMIIGFGSERSSSTTTARATAAGSLDANGNVLRWYGNSGLTAGNTFTPTLRLEVDSSGYLRNYANQAWFGLGGGTNNSPGIGLGDFADASQVFIVAKRSGGATSLVLRAADYDASIIKIQPGNVGDDLSSAIHAKASGAFYAMHPQWTVLGGSAETSQTPGVMTVRFTDVLNGSGACQSLHGAPILKDGRVLLCQAWFRGNSDEAIPLTITSIDDFRVYATSGTGAYSGREVVGFVMYTSLARW